MELNCILLDLEIIKQVKEDDKLGLTILPGKKKLFVDLSSRLSSITRWYNGYNREDTIIYLEEITEKIEKFSIFVKNGNHNNMGIVLKDAIKEAIKGIENLKITYTSDSITVAKLVLIVNKLVDVTLKLDNMETLTNDIFTREVENEL
tara:strand:- start:705 stop:1148 length:444 start_codon:yes stop_codon:yes gene_type:complete